MSSLDPQIVELVSDVICLDADTLDNSTTLDSTAKRVLAEVLALLRRLTGNTDESANRARRAKRIKRALWSLMKEFSDVFRDQSEELLRDFNIAQETITGSILGISNELFADGIKWARIVALFVFGRKLAAARRDLSGPIVDTITQFVGDKLSSWVRDHGDWDGLVLFNEPE